jgi:hypothetical protein
MALQVAGTMMRDRTKKPLMDRQDSKVKKSMKSVMKMGRTNRPDMPKLMKKTEKK